jgi:hypothetical protein
MTAQAASSALPDRAWSARGVDRRLAEAKADAVAVPLSVTKRGGLVFARKA